MSDTPKRLFGPGSGYMADGRLIYTCPDKTKAFIRDITLTNTAASALVGRLALGDATNTGNLLIAKSVSALSTYSFRGLWILNPGETLEIMQETYPATQTWTGVNTWTAAAASSVATAAWTPAASTLYLLVVTNSKTDAPDAVSSITGNGTWTQAATTTSGSVAAQTDLRLSAYYWYSASAGSSATTTVNFGGAAQTQIQGVILSVSNVLTSSLTPYTAPIVNSATSVDVAAPASTASGLTVNLGTLTGGIVFYAQARVNPALRTAAPPTGYTEIHDLSAGSVLNLETGQATTPPASSAVVPACTWSNPETTLRAALALEFAPNISTSTLNFMLNAVEVAE